VTVTDVNSRGRFLAQGNVYLPHMAVVEKIVDETYDTKTFHINFKDEKLRAEFTFESGQFCLCSVFGIGEAPFAISSSPTRKSREARAGWSAMSTERAPASPSCCARYR